MMFKMNEELSADEEDQNDERRWNQQEKDTTSRQHAELGWSRTSLIFPI